MHLTCRGYKPDLLQPLFLQARQNALAKLQVTNHNVSDTPQSKKQCYLHVTYHPNDPASNLMQQCFRDHLFNPIYRPIQQLLSSIPSLPRRQKQETRPTYPMETNHMIICYHRPQTWVTYSLYKTSML